MSFARLALSRIASGREHYIIRTVVAVFPYLCFGKKSFYLLNTEGHSDVLLRHVRTDATWNSSKLLDTEGSPDRKFSSSGRMMLDR